MTPSGRDRADAAAVLRRILVAVDRGDLDAPGAAGGRLLRRMEGAAAAWKAAGPGPGQGSDPDEGIPEAKAPVNGMGGDGPPDSRPMEPPPASPPPPICVRGGCEEPAPNGRFCPRHLYG